MRLRGTAHSHAWVALLAVACLPACRASSPPGETPAAKPRVALVMKSLANEFFVTMAKGAEAHQQAHAGDYDLIVNGTRNESDLAQQVALVEQMIASGVQALRSPPPIPVRWCRW